MNHEIQQITSKANRNIKEVSRIDIRKLIHHIVGLEGTMQKVAELADTGTSIHQVIFDPYADGKIVSGWRVAEKMRECLLEVLSSERGPRATVTCECGKLVDVSPMLNADLELLCDDLAMRLNSATAELEKLRIAKRDTVKE